MEDKNNQQLKSEASIKENELYSKVRTIQETRDSVLFLHNESLDVIRSKINYLNNIDTKYLSYIFTILFPVIRTAPQSVQFQIFYLIIILGKFHTLLDKRFIDHVSDNLSYILSYIMQSRNEYDIFMSYLMR